MNCFSADATSHSGLPGSPDDEKAPILRAYLKRWKAEVGSLLDGVSASSPEEELRRIAPGHPGVQDRADLTMGRASCHEQCVGTGHCHRVQDTPSRSRG